MTVPFSNEELRRHWEDYQRQRNQRTSSPSDRAPVTGGAAPEGYGERFTRGLVRSAAQGFPLAPSFADEIEAGVKTGFGLAGDYRAHRDAIRAENAEFAHENPVPAIAAPLVTGLVGGAGLTRMATNAPKLARVLEIMGISPKMSATATQAQRIGSAAKAGAKIGAVAGAGAAPEMSDLLTYVPGGAALGAGFGGAFAAGGELIGGARNLAGQVGRDATQPVGPIRARVQEETPQVAAARKWFARIGKGKTDLDAVEAVLRDGPPDLTVAEAVDIAAGKPLPSGAPRGGSQQGVSGLRIARNVGTIREDIDAGLSERAAEGPAKLMQIRGQATGVTEPMDFQVFKQAEIAKVEPTVERLMQRAYQQPPVADPNIAKITRRLSRMKEFGPEVLRRANTFAEARGETFPASFVSKPQPAKYSTVVGPDGQPIQVAAPTPAQPVPVSVRNVVDLRRGFQEVMDEMEGQIAQGKGSPELFRQMTQMRKSIDAIAKRAGGPALRKADKLWETTMSRIESFQAGQNVERIGTAQGLEAAKGKARDPEGFRIGAASKAQERTAGVVDGESGQLRNPVPQGFGSPTRRARESMGYKNPQDFDATRERVKDIVRDFTTRQRVSGNSATFGNAGEAANEFADNADKVLALMQTPVNPTSSVRLLGEKGAFGLFRGMSGQIADEMGRIGAAGLPNQMPSREALDLLRRLEPGLVKQLERQVARRGLMGGLTARLGQELGQ